MVEPRAAAVAIVSRPCPALDLAATHLAATHLAAERSAVHRACYTSPAIFRRFFEVVARLPGGLAKGNYMAESRGQSAYGAIGVAEAPRSLLLIEADEAVGATLAAVLRHDGYAVRLASSMAQATSLLREEPAELVLAEIADQERADLSALTEIQTLTPGASVIVLTSYATLESALRALREGAVDYLAKPVDVEELRHTLTRVVERRRLEQELAARVGELEAAHAELRELNAELQQRIDAATAELQRQVEALDAANHELRASQEQHNRFIAMVAHEMRGPLGPIINYAQLAKRPAVTPEKRAEYLDIIVEHAFRMNRLVDDLQTATRLSTGRFTLQHQPCDVAAAVAGLVEQFNASVRDRQFSLERPDEAVLAEVDSDRVLQATRNLVDNAIKYSTEGGAIELGVWQDGERVFIRVGDYGAGIPEAERERIFQPFTRLEQRNPDAMGSGLGLYITRGIVAAHGGELSVVNREGEQRAHGAIFTLALPVCATAPTPEDG
jgi:signal transduction histidine kinase